MTNTQAESKTQSSWHPDVEVAPSVIDGADERLEWQQRRRMRRCENAPVLSHEFWDLFVEGTKALTEFDEPRALSLLARADACCPREARTRAALDETLGEAKFLVNEYGAALEHLRRAQSLWAEVKEPLYEAEARAWMGACLVQQGRYQDGFEHLQVALESFERLGQPERGARALNSLAIIHEELGDKDRAFEAYARAHAAAVADGDVDMQGRVLANRGEAHMANGEPQLALEDLGNAVELLRSIGAHWHYGWCLLSIGRLHLTWGDSETALEFHEEALEAVERGHSPQARVEVYGGLGELYSKCGRHQEAFSWLKRSLALATDLGVQRDVFKAHQLLAQAHKRAGNFETALNHHELFHEVRSAVFDQLARERVATLKAEFELQRVEQSRELERLRNHELRVAYEELEERAKSLTQLSERDGLTGLFNRRRFDEALALELSRAQTHGQPVTLAILDIDHFKRVNDGFSHITGDQVLRVIGSVIQGELRQSDVAARYGGEEFAIVFPHTSLEGARIAAEKVRVAIATADWDSLTPCHGVTASLGLAQWTPGETPVALLRRADQALYAAKASGRNRIRAA